MHESVEVKKSKRRWVRILFQILTEVLLIIPILLILWYFGRIIENKKAKESPDESGFIEEMEDPWMEEWIL